MEAKALLEGSFSSIIRNNGMPRVPYRSEPSVSCSLTARIGGV
jgi:hypothetical protein